MPVTDGSLQYGRQTPWKMVLLESEATMHAVILQVSTGSDVIATLSAFTCRHGVGVFMLCGTGAVVAVTLRSPTSLAAAASTMTLRGKFEVLSFSGTVLPPSSQLGPPLFLVSLVGTGGGQVFTRRLVGLMTVAAGGMVLMAAMFGSAQMHCVPHMKDGGSSEPGGPDHAEDQQQPMVVAVDISGMGLGSSGSGGGEK
jgi:predicted DNA-binding protein with PD1-like motif